MAVLYLTEFRNTALDARANSIPAPKYPSVTQQTVSIGGGSLQSAAFGAETAFLLISTDAICHFDIDENPTATSGFNRLAAGQSIFVGVVAGHKLAVIEGT